MLEALDKTGVGKLHEKLMRLKYVRSRG